MRHRFPNIRSFNIMNVSLAVAGLLLLGGGLWQTFHHSLHLSDAVSLILLLAVVRPSWRGAWGRNFWASDLRFSQTGDRSPGLFNSGIFCGLAPWLNYILIDNVYGHPDVFGPHPTCNDRVRLSLLGAGVPVALPVTPYAVSLLILAIALATLATEARHFGLADEVRLASVLQDLNVRQMLLRDENPWDSRTRVLDSYNKSLQNNWVDVTHYRCTVSVLGRLYLIATLEHTLFLNRNEKGGVLGPGLKLLQPVTILSIACILLQGLACSWFMQEKDDDDDYDTHLDLFQWLLSTANQPGTVLGSLANSISFDRQILSTYFNMRGASSTRGIHPGLNQMLVRSRQELRRQTRRLAREAKNVMPLPNECMLSLSPTLPHLQHGILAKGVLY
ncbi:hypothetical protein CDV31_011589 [Fusarium ambrosium]|uniref:Uncharacterized protein n=1 Tax=Fusarium ambrosium TaxID=131363 RepID=A0A428TG10_9HYPO|nr:hypothetical protein CDV31_011589 [Fusarium ambrosium]